MFVRQEWTQAYDDRNSTCMRSAIRYQKILLTDRRRLVNCPLKLPRDHITALLPSERARVTLLGHERPAVHLACPALGQRQHIRGPGVDERDGAAFAYQHGLAGAADPESLECDSTDYQPGVVSVWRGFFSLRRRCRRRFLLPRCLLRQLRHRTSSARVQLREEQDAACGSVRPRTRAGRAGRSMHACAMTTGRQPPREHGCMRRGCP